MTDEIFMQRCFDLARLGAGNVSPNPMVGAVLVHQGRIIGEGWHRQYGQAHAEVNCVASVAENERQLISKSTLYVSLEPCCFHGKTPACTDLILRERIPKVVIAALDSTPEVSGKGVEILRNLGVEVEVGIGDKQSCLPGDFRNLFVSKKRPFIQLKFAKSADGYMGKTGEQVWFSNHFSQVLAHKGRAEMDAILVGTDTALTDDPALTNRLWFGKSPLRIVLDRHRRLPSSLKLFDGKNPTWVITDKELPTDVESTDFKVIRLGFTEDLLEKLLDLLYNEKIGLLIVEGGALTLKSFLEKNLWDEALIVTSQKRMGTGILAPTPLGIKIASFQLGTDTLTILKNGEIGR